MEPEDLKNSPELESAKTKKPRTRKKVQTDNVDDQKQISEETASAADAVLKDPVDPSAAELAGEPERPGAGEGLAEVGMMDERPESGSETIAKKEVTLLQVPDQVETELLAVDLPGSENSIAEGGSDGYAPDEPELHEKNFPLPVDAGVVESSPDDEPEEGLKEMASVPESPEGKTETVDFEGVASGTGEEVPYTGEGIPDENAKALEAGLDSVVPAGETESIGKLVSERNFEETTKTVTPEPAGEETEVQPAAQQGVDDFQEEVKITEEPGENPEDERSPISRLSEEYAQLTQNELVKILRDAVEAGGETDHNIDAVVALFYHKSKEASDQAKRDYLSGGGDPAAFLQEEDPYIPEVKELLKRFRQIRFEIAKKLDAEKEQNLQRKYEIIEEIKNLLNKEESINRTFQEFRDLQRKWYDIGQVPQARMKDLWDTYHFHVENFYDYIKINKELRDLDLKKNLEAKIQICEKAEELLMEPSVLRAFNALQKYHDDWREIGPVPPDKKDEIWERFKAATSQINLKHQDYFEKRKSEQKKNLDAKVALCEKAEEISSVKFESHRDWDEKSRDLVELQKVWKTIGFAPKKDNNRIYNRFREACDRFFVNKREYYSKNKDIQQTNLQMKIDLCMEAETLKESDDWKKTTQQFIDIQRRWKEIGPVPRKSSDAIWKRFRAACDYFFERKAGHFNDIDGEQLENQQLKEQIIEEVERFKPESDLSASLKILRDFQRRWTEIGHVPLKNKDSLQLRFRDAINKHFDTLKIDSPNRSTFNFRNKIESMTDNSRGLMKVRSEREKYMIKLKQLESDLSLLDNNIGFFANSKNAQALIADVNQKIQDTREKIDELKEKIRIIDDLDKSEY